MSRKGRESKERRVARSRRRRVRRHSGCSYVRGGRTLGARGSDRAVGLRHMSFYSLGLWDAIDSMVMVRIDRMVCCRGCLYTNESYAYCGLGMSPNVSGCNHKEPLMKESHD